MDLNDQVIVQQKQLHGNTSLVLDGELIAFAENKQVLVQINGEEVPRLVPEAAVTSLGKTFGESYTSRFNELPVQDQIRR